MATIGQNIPIISTAPNAQQFNAVATIVNSLRNIHIGSGLVGSYTTNGLSIASNSVSTPNAASTIPWGKEWICGLEAVPAVSGANDFQINVYNHITWNAANHAEMFPSSHELVPLSITPTVSDLNGQNRTVLCLNLSGGLEFLPDFSNADYDTEDVYRTYEPLYVLEMTYDGSYKIQTAVVVLDIVHGAQRDPLQYGYERYYSSNTAASAAKKAGDWVYLQDIAGLPIRVLMEDTPPVVEDSLSLDYIDRKDYAIVSYGNYAPLPEGFTVESGPYLLPVESDGSWEEKTSAEMKDLLKNILTFDQFQRDNIWIIEGTHMRKISYLNISEGINGIVRGLNGLYSLDASIPGSLPSEGNKASAFCIVDISANPSYAYQEVVTNTSQIESDLENLTNLVNSLTGEQAGTEIDTDGSVTSVQGASSVTIKLFGDDALTDLSKKYLYTVSTTTVTSGVSTGNRAWQALPSTGMIAISSDGVRLAGTTTTSPGTGSIYGFNMNNNPGWIKCYEITFSQEF